MTTSSQNEKASGSIVRIALVGNIANNFFRDGKALRESDSLDVHLYMRKNDDTPNTELPESDEPCLAGNYPEWIHIFEDINIKTVLLKHAGIHPSPDNNLQKLIDELSRYDLCIFSGPELVILPFVKTRTLFRATGSDLTVHPVFSYSEFYRARPGNKKISIFHPFSKMLKVLRYYLRRYAYRKAIAEANFIDWCFGEPFKLAVEKLNIPKKKLINIFRLTIDQSVFKRSTEATQKCNLRWAFESDDFLVFMPSRIMIRDTKLHRLTGQWKASDVGIRGFKIFLDKLDDADAQKAFLVIPERTLSDDLAAAKQLVKELGLCGNVRFVSGDAEDGLTRHELIQFYSRVNAVFDDFGAGWFGSVVVEALSCECPVITYVTEEMMQNMYGWHSLLIAKTAEDIRDRLLQLHRDPDLAEKIGKESRRWIQEFHSNAAVKQTLSAELLKLATRP